MMDHFTSVAYRLEQQRAAALARETELRRTQAERAPVTSVEVEPVSRGRVTAAWAGFLRAAHLGHPVPH